MSAMLLSIKPQYAEMIIEGTKRYEFRTRKCRDDIKKIIHECYPRTVQFSEPATVPIHSY